MSNQRRSSNIKQMTEELRRLSTRRSSNSVHQGTHNQRPSYTQGTRYNSERTYRQPSRHNQSSNYSFYSNRSYSQLPFKLKNFENFEDPALQEWDDYGFEDNRIWYNKCTETTHQGFFEQPVYKNYSRRYSSGKNYKKLYNVENRFDYNSSDSFTVIGMNLMINGKELQLYYVMGYGPPSIMEFTRDGEYLDYPMTREIGSCVLYNEPMEIIVTPHYMDDIEQKIVQISAPVTVNDLYSSMDRALKQRLPEDIKQKAIQANEWWEYERSDEREFNKLQNKINRYRDLWDCHVYFEGIQKEGEFWRPLVGS